MCKPKNSDKLHDELLRPMNFDQMDESLWNVKCDYVEPEKCIDQNPNNLNLIVLQLNMQSILSHQTELKTPLNDQETCNSRVDIVLLCETFLNKQTVKLVKIPNYMLISNHQSNCKGGGTAILVQNDILFKSHKDLDIFQEKTIESVFIEISSKSGKKITVGSLYHPPNNTPLEFTTKLNEITCKIKLEKDKEVILGMDHNLDLLKSGTHKSTQLFLEDLLDKNMLPIITRPTRITQNSTTLIDNIFVSEKLYHFFEFAVIISDMSDHLPALSLLKQTKLLAKTSLEFESHNLTETKIKTIRMKLQQVDWTNVLNNASSSESFDNFLAKVNNITDEVSPLKKSKSPQNRDILSPGLLGVWKCQGEKTTTV